jgi:hypothetical protein
MTYIQTNRTLLPSILAAAAAPASVLTAARKLKGFVDPGAFFVTNPLESPKLKLDECFSLHSSPDSDLYVAGNRKATIGLETGIYVLLFQRQDSCPNRFSNIGFFLTNPRPLPPAGAGVGCVTPFKTSVCCLRPSSYSHSRSSEELQQMISSPFTAGSAIVE